MILAIETSCDETAVAVIANRQVLSNIIYSQLEIHQQYGGVVPSLAKLAHQQKLPGVLAQALTVANVEMSDITAIAVTGGPGLAIALEVGVGYAKELSQKYQLPLIVVNHMAGHLFSALCMVGESGGAHLNIDALKFPAVGALVSGGHTEFILVQDLDRVKKVGQTLDDACGEAFDKFATMLGLPYPGGPKVSKLAAENRHRLDLVLEKDHQTLFVRAYEKGKQEIGKPKYQLPIPLAHSGDLRMSYSGLKTAAKQLINSLSNSSSKLDIKQTGLAEQLDQVQTGELCVVFEHAALQALILKLEAAVDSYSAKEVWLGGGVAASPRLRELVADFANKKGVEFRVAADKGLLTDNAAMIGFAAEVIQKTLLEGKEVPSNLGRVLQPDQLDSLDREPGWSL